jgi:peptidoglycan-N-acetylmuramic acid deacetylase
LKRTIALLTALCLLGLTACSRDNGQSASDIPSSQTESSSAVSKPDPELIPNVGDESSAVETLTTDISQLDNTKHGWGQGTNFDDQNRPGSCLEFQEKFGKYDAVFIKENAEGKLYLTFDEGYENGYTTKILDTLQEKNVPAVFFVTYDYASKNPDLIKRMIDEGHVVGNHSYNHPSMPTVSLEKGEEEITKLHNYIKDTFGYEMTLFRPPMGEYSERTLALAQNLGYQSVFWSFAYADWDPKKQPEPEAALKKTVERVHNGAVYLLHAVSETNTQILGDFIDQVCAKGFSFEKLQ